MDKEPNCFNKDIPESRNNETVKVSTTETEVNIISEVLLVEGQKIEEIESGDEERHDAIHKDMSCESLSESGACVYSPPKELSYDTLTDVDSVDNTCDHSDLEEVFTVTGISADGRCSPVTPSLSPSPPPLLTSTPQQPPRPLFSSLQLQTPDANLLHASHNEGPPSLPASGPKSYDYLLKVLLVGDSDVGKQEILSGLEDGGLDSPYVGSTGAAFKTSIILIDGKRVKLQLWDTSGQGRFCTIIRSYSRGAQGILLVYDITNKWSFEGMDRWVREVEEHAPGIPKVLVGNRLHLAFKRQVDQTEAEEYAERNQMGFYEVSPLVNFNITESFQELCRMALKRNGMERLWRSNKVLTLHELCTHSIVARTNVYGIEKLPLPDAIKANLKSYALTTNQSTRNGNINYKSFIKDKKKKPGRPPDAVESKCVNVSRKSCVIS